MNTRERRNGTLSVTDNRLIGYKKKMFFSETSVTKYTILWHKNAKCMLQSAYVYVQTPAHNARKLLIYYKIKIVRLVLNVIPHFRAFFFVSLSSIFLYSWLLARQATFVLTFNQYFFSSRKPFSSIRYKFVKIGHWATATEPHHKPWAKSVYFVTRPQTTKWIWVKWWTPAIPMLTIFVW